MTEPRTKAGRRAFYTDWDHVDHFRVGQAVREAILAIEAEAAVPVPALDATTLASLKAEFSRLLDRRPQRIVSDVEIAAIFGRAELSVGGMSDE